MTRLRHSFQGYFRALQISSTQVFVFTEGVSDRYFYDKVCRQSGIPAATKHEVRLAEELPGGTGGKNALLDVYTYLARRRALLNEFSGKRTLVMFYLDKDVDDLLRRLRRSAHIIYTADYELENHVFRHTDLVEAAASTASLDHATVAAGLQDVNAWRQRCAVEWRNWVILCVAAQLGNAHTEVNYGAESRIHTDGHGAEDPARHAASQQRMQRALGMSAGQFGRLLRRATRIVDRVYAVGRHDRVFRGKWYAGFLARDLRAIARGRRMDQHSLDSRLRQAALNRLDYQQPWAHHFVEPLRAMVGQLLS